MTSWTPLSAYLVRIAGFALERLAALGCAHAAAADEALVEATRARGEAGRALDEGLGRERYAGNPAFDDPEVRRALALKVKQVRAFARRAAEAALSGDRTAAPSTPAADLTATLPVDALREVVRAVPAVAALAAALEDAHARWQDAMRAYDIAFAEDFARARAQIRAMYRDPRLQEAVFLESPEAFDRIQQLIASDGPRNARARQRERLAAMYAQRFCAKNDTNSMCGPHGVGYLTAARGATRLEVAVEDARRVTYFSHWAAQRLLDEAVRRADDPHLATLRLHPMTRVDGTQVAWCTVKYDGWAFLRRHARSDLPEASARLVVEALARTHSEAELAGLGGALGLGADELAAFVEQLVSTGIAQRGPVLPPGLPFPLRAVAELVERWPASEARSWALAEVAALEDRVDAFARAPLAGRLESFQQIGARFEAATGGAATRGEGRHYADRSVLHEDCFVDVRSEVGAARASLDGALPVLAQALELTIDLARERVREWFRARFGESIRVPALEVHRAFDGDRVLDTPATTARAAVLREALARVQAAIGRAADASGGGPVRLSSHELRLALDGVAPPAHAGYLSVDVMPRALPDGRVELVLSEVHGILWLSTCLLDVLPPDHRERVLGEMRSTLRDLARGRRAAECMFLHTQATDRRLPVAPVDLEFLAPSERSEALELRALDLVLAGDELQFLHGDEEVIPLVAFNRYQFLYLTSRFAPVFDHHVDRFPDSLLPEALRTGDVPRLSVDDLVFQRRLWRRPASQVRAALAARSEPELFRRAQALRRELGCDACVFASVSGEPKPVLLDFENVFLVEALVNLLERCPADASVKLSEMLPAPGELVCRAPDGLRTAELRMGFWRTGRL